MSEPELPKAAEPDPGARRDKQFPVFYRANTKPLVAFLIQQGAPLALAADVAQDTMIKAYQQWQTIQHPRAWCYRVAARALTRCLLDERDTPVGHPAEHSPLLRGTDIDGWELNQDLFRALAELPPRQRQIMAWTLAGYTPTEIAEELWVAPSAVRQNLYLARRALAERIRKDDA